LNQDKGKHPMIVDDFLARTAGSRAHAARAARVLPDGVSTDTRYFEPYGIYVDRGAGARKWDVDGNEYRDFFGGHGALMLGHSHPRLTHAIQSAAERGIPFAASSPLEVDWAESIQEHIPTAERVRFTGSGTEATLLAIRIARAFVRRPKLIRVSTHYHGWHDFAVSGYNSFFDGSAAPGVLAEIAQNTVLVAPNDVAGLGRAIHTHRGEIAAMLLEPLGCHFGIVPTSDVYLKEAVHLANENDIPIILDEVISAFRVGPSGMQGHLGLQPDLTCMGKVAAGGMPGGIVCGAARVMSVLSRHSSFGHDPQRRVFHQGTFTGNPVTANAALATIDEIVSRNLCDHATQLGELTRSRLNQAFKRLDICWRAYGRFSGFHIFPELPRESLEGVESLPWDVFASRPAPILQSLRMALNLEGVDIGSRGTGFLSGIHQCDDVDYLIAAFESALLRLRQERLIQ
jgi:glutamate-1-semialdehyde 2,1-aminomutase